MLQHACCSSRLLLALRACLLGVQLANTSSCEHVRPLGCGLLDFAQDQLERVLFPIGHLPKSEVRALAEELQLPNRQRKDSQGICFLGQLNYDDFLRDHLGERPGPVFEFETKQVIGTHRGLWFHTVGQRRGLVPVLTNAFAAKGPWYVVKKDVENNALHVSREYTAADKSRARAAASKQLLHTRLL
eukprot:6184778-Pleurochrysis_carterae.AAC.2